MTVTVRSFAKINVGLYIGAVRPDGYHELRTIYQTISLHDVIRISVARGTGIKIHCDDACVPCDESNTCYRVAERTLKEFGKPAKVIIEIEKRLPVRGGLGAGSSNAVATMMGLERALKRQLSGAARLRIACEIGSDLPLFVLGGTVLGVGRGEEVYPLADIPVLPIVIVTPEVGVSTPAAFADWDALMAHAEGAEAPSAGQPRAAVPAWHGTRDRLTHVGGSDRLITVGRVLSSWLSGFTETGAPARAGSRAGNLLLDLVRTGIENDFEKVVFPRYPELRDIKRAFESAGAVYASLSGSGSALYGLFRTREAATIAAVRLRKQGLKARATVTLRREQYWKKLRVASS
jgi:4-diphosphocytidyl-2-C-methyl-D-erythritol kinase